MRDIFMKQLIFAILAASLLQAQAIPSVDGRTGTVAGRVVNAGGKGVGGAFVLLVSEFDASRSAKDFTATARSVTVDPEGNFGFSEVAPGHYKLCAEPSHVNHWNNCWWGDAVELDVLPGRVAGPLAITVGTALPVRVRIKDPKALRAEAKKNKELVGFAANVRTGTRIAVPMRVESDDGNELVLVAVAPVDKELKLRVGSQNGKFKDDDKVGANPDKLSDEYTIPAGDSKAREIKVTLQSLEKAK